MKKDAKQLSLSRALLAGLFCGIAAAVVVAIYSIIYRDQTNFSRLLIVNAMVICAFIPLVVLIAASIYYLLVHYLGRGEMLFETVFILLLLIAIIKDISFDSSTVMTMSHGFLFGLEIIIGLAICVFLPYLVHHPKIYMTNDEMKWE